MATPKTCADLGITNDELTKRENLRFYNIMEEPFRIYGMTHDGEWFVRMPKDVAAGVNGGVAGMYRHTTGGRVRFVTDAPYLAFFAKGGFNSVGMNRTSIAASGFDVYIERTGFDTFAGVFRPPYGSFDRYDGVLGLPAGEKKITINFPLTNAVSELWLGVEEGAALTRREDYAYEKPVLFYGSSITHGIGASRPGIAYPGYISRRLNTNFVNLGFSGSAKAEDTMIAYLTEQDPSVFVLDYDHNALNSEHLAATHEKLYLAFRAAHPDTPVVMIGRPDFHLTSQGDIDRRDVIFATYRNARARGEKVLFVDGYSLFHGEMRDDCTVDGCHPNDVGMMRMADVIGKAVEFALSM